MKTAWRQILTRYKLMSSKSAASIPKDKFPKLLKHLMETIAPRAADNLKAGFRKCGICPFNEEPVLQRLPSTSALNVSNESVSQAFVEHLRALREGKIMARVAGRDCKCHLWLQVQYDMLRNSTTTSNKPAHYWAQNYNL